MRMQSLWRGESPMGRGHLQELRGKVFAHASGRVVGESILYPGRPAGASVRKVRRASRASLTSLSTGSRKQAADFSLRTSKYCPASAGGFQVFSLKTEKRPSS